MGFVGRMVEELNQLEERLDKLGIFLNSYSFLTLDEKRKDLLEEQYTHMVSYKDILKARIVLESK